MAPSDRVERARRGDRIELLQRRLGVSLRGTVFYSDQLQVLVKWDDGRSENLRPGVAFRMIEAAGSENRP